MEADRISRWNRVVTRGRRFIAEVDGLRFLAIASVVLFHLKSDTQFYLVRLPATQGRAPNLTGFEELLIRVLDLGQYGVQLFFVLSGFLLALPFARWRFGKGPRPGLRAYFLRRLTRLEPPYIAAMLLVFLVTIAGAAAAIALSRMGLRSSSLHEIPNHLPSLLASLVYQHNLLFGRASTVNPVAWSLEVEVQFYVLAPLLAMVFAIRNTRLRRSILLAALLAAPLWRALAYPRGSELLRLSLPGQIEFFLTGFLLVDLYLLDWGEEPSRGAIWDAIGFAGWAALAVLLWTGRHPWLIAPAIGIAYTGAFKGRLTGAMITRPVITVIGGMCYTIYLLHYALISNLGALLQSMRWGSTFSGRLVVEALLSLPAVVVVTLGFFSWLERPCMDPAWPAKLAEWTRAKLRRSYRPSTAP
jgi:peptidoglycan/LPS O-acetylase OafA/YrhL